MYEWATLVGIALTTVGAVWSLAWWFSGKFSNLTRIFYTEIEKLQSTILNKLEYHERHDDKRFADVRDDIWEIRLRNAAIDGTSKHSRERAEYQRQRKEFVDQNEKDHQTPNT